MKLLVGLGNPGEKYEQTRHNIGFSVLERFLKDFESIAKTEWQDEKKFKSDMVRLDWQPKKGKDERVLLVKPKTFMNNSGLAVSLIAEYFKIVPADIWVIHDELDLPIGSLKIRLGGSSAGHRGVESIMEKLGTDKFWRFRMGIGQVKNHGEIARSKMHGVDDYVLGPFSQKQTGDIRKLIKKTSKAVMQALEDGLEKAQNQFNT